MLLCGTTPNSWIFKEAPRLLVKSHCGVQPILGIALGVLEELLGDWGLHCAMLVRYHSEHLSSYCAIAFPNIP